MHVVQQLENAHNQCMPTSVVIESFVGPYWFPHCTAVVSVVTAGLAGLVELYEHIRPTLSRKQFLPGSGTSVDVV